MISVLFSLILLTSACDWGKIIQSDEKFIRECCGKNMNLYYDTHVPYLKLSPLGLAISFRLDMVPFVLGCTENPEKHIVLKSKNWNLLHLLAYQGDKHVLLQKMVKKFPSLLLEEDIDGYIPLNLAKYYNRLDGGGHTRTVEILRGD